MDMLDWSPDFCLTCDRQSVSGGAYCSQSCRLADLERASNGSSATSSPQSSPVAWTAPAPHGNGFYLPPALNFPARSSQQTPSSASPRGSISSSSSSSTPPSAVYLSSQQYTHNPYSTNYASAGQCSTYDPSSSRISLSSMQSTSQQESGYLSDKAKNELRDYASSFLVRDWKRRMTVV